MEKIVKTEEEWMKELGPEKYRILRGKGTEAAGTGAYYHEKANGMYVCGACGLELFSSDAKYDSGSGWPSFFEASKNENLVLERDDSHGMSRVEVMCARCGSHLGHLFDDGPADKTGKRFCINSASLELKKKGVNPLKWFHDERTAQSPVNGTITCRRVYGRWEVYADGLPMSSWNLRTMWRSTLRWRLPLGFRPRNVLVLGLGAGDLVMELARFFPRAVVTAVELDREMVTLADTLGLFPRAKRPEVIVGDAAAVIETLSGPYDLMFVDIFSGGGVAPAAFGEAFFGRVDALLSPHGHVIVNSYLQPELLDRAGASLHTESRWLWRTNRLGRFVRKS